MTREEYDFLVSVGGTPNALVAGAADGFETVEWNFGLSHPAANGAYHMSRDVERVWNVRRSMMPRFRLNGRAREGPEKVILWDYLKDPLVTAATGGRVFSGFHQYTGSCVGVGSGDLIQILAAVEVVRLREPETAYTPFWPFHYGRGRLRSGIRGRGEGSTSEGQADALEQDGTLQEGLEGLPKYANDDGLSLPSGIEMEWSDGARIAEKWLAKAKPFSIRSQAVCKSADDARTAIRNGYPIMFCGSWGGLMKCPIVGTRFPCLLNRRASVWYHNETCIATWDHPELGLLFGIKNQWGNNVHGQDPAGLPPGAYWIKETDFEYQSRQGSCIVVSQYNGYPNQDWIDWGW